MTSVVSFLTMLQRDADESNGNVRRMLSVCSEFERIARVVLDKAERDMRGGRGKRKADKHGQNKGREDSFETGLDEGKTLEQMQIETQSKYRRPVQTPSMRASVGGGSDTANSRSPASWNSPNPSAGGGSEYRTPNTSTSGYATDGGSAGGLQPPQHQSQSFPGQWNNNGYGLANGGNPYQQNQQSFSSNSPQPPPNFSQPPNMGNDAFNPATTGTGFTPDPSLAGFDPLATAPAGFNMSGAGDGNGAGSFQQPFVPQDLWQMPMTLEWDWAEGLGLGSFTPGPMFDEYGLGTVGMEGQPPHQQ